MTDKPEGEFYRSHRYQPPPGEPPPGDTPKRNGAKQGPNGSGNGHDKRAHGPNGVPGAKPAGAGEQPHAVRAELITLEDLQMEPTDWVWDGWIASSTIQLIAGVPEAGKDDTVLYRSRRSCRAAAAGLTGQRRSRQCSDLDGRRRSGPHHQAAPHPVGRRPQKDNQS